MPLRALQLCWTHPLSCIARASTCRRTSACIDVGEQLRWWVLMLHVHRQRVLGSEVGKKCPCGGHG